MKFLSALQAGLAGAGSLTLMHQKLKKVDEDAPRMDLLGMNALARMLRVPFEKLEGNPAAYNLTLIGDILCNSFYYSLVGLGGKKGVLSRGALLGLLAGAGAVVLPKYLKLNEAYSNRSELTKAETVALYLIAGIIASAEYKATTKGKTLKSSKKKK